MDADESRVDETVSETTETEATETETADITDNAENEPTEPTTSEDAGRDEVPAEAAAPEEVPIEDAPAAAEPIEPPADESQDDSDLSHHDQLMQHIDAMQGFDDGDVVSGTVVRIDRDEVLVDIGYKSEGVIPSRELSIQRDAKPDDVVSLGEEIDALVLQKEDKDGRLILSKKRAEYEKSWVGIEKVFREEGTVDGKVIEVVKGGLILDIGLRGFLPASLVDLRRVKDLDQFVGTTLTATVIEMDRNRNNVVLSRRKVLEEERRSERQAILSQLEKGQVLTGSVSSIVDFGAFVDLGGIDGLVHISELSWTHVGHPSEVVQVGEEVKVQVLDVDRDRERISLGLKQTQEDPWKKKVRDLPIGEVVKGRVTKLVPFGAFIELIEGVEGLAHISELAHEHVEVPEQVVQVGDEIHIRIMDIDLDRRRISLSLKQVGVAPADADEELRPVAPDEGEAEEAEAAGTDEAEEAAAEEVAEEAAPEEVAEAEASGEPEVAEAAEGEETESEPEGAAEAEGEAEEQAEAAEPEVEASDEPGPAE